MVDSVGGKSISSQSSPLGIKLGGGKDKPDFMSSLQTQFEKIKKDLCELPGLPGVYTANPQTLATLKVITVSPEVDPSPVI